MRNLLSIFLGSALALSAVTAQAKLTGPMVKRHVEKRLQYSSRVPDKTLPMTVKLYGKKGDKVRRFRASNIRETYVTRGPNDAPLKNGIRLHTGNVVSGTVNM